MINRLQLHSFNNSSFFSFFLSPLFHVQICGRPEIAPDQREKYLQRLQQVQQQGHGALLSVPHLSGANHKQIPMQQENSVLQQVFLLYTSLLFSQMVLKMPFHFFCLCIFDIVFFLLEVFSLFSYKASRLILNSILSSPLHDYKLVNFVLERLLKMALFP